MKVGKGDLFPTQFSALRRGAQLDLDVPSTLVILERTDSNEPLHEGVLPDHRGTVRL